MKIVVLDADTFHFPDDRPWAPLRACGELVLHGTTPSDSATVTGRCRGAEIVLTNKVPLSGETISRLPDLKMIGVLATGFNIIDVKAAREHNIPVCNVPDYARDFVAQHTLALSLALCNRTHALDHWVHQGGWSESPVFCWWDRPLLEFSELTVGIIGFGSIGRRVGEIFHGFGSKILGYARTRRDTPDWERFAWASIPEIFGQADLVSLHCPQTPDNARFVNADLLGRMKPSAYLVNTARGGLIDESALCQALDAGHLAGAAVDVADGEPIHPDNPLLRARNMIITPHVAWGSGPCRTRLLQTVEANIQAFQKGTPQNVVN